MSFLHKIRQHHAPRIESLKALPPVPDRHPQNSLRSTPPSTPQFSDCCTRSVLTSRPFVWIAEIKQASPSRGVFAQEVDPVAVAQSYVRQGADMLSILTEPHFFKGSLSTLAAVRAACPETPLLMKDFILDPLQIAHGQAAGAHAFLLIMALLSDAEFQELYSYGLERGLLPLVEIHSQSDLERLARAVQNKAIPSPPLIGVNHRCLHTLKIDLQRSQTLYPRLRKCFPEARLIAESGLSQAQDILRLQRLGYQGCLVGSAFMVHPDPGQMLGAWKSEVAQHLNAQGALS